MKNSKLNIILSLMAAFSLVIATSCNHKDLCYYHPHTAPVRVNVDWNGYAVDGMTAHLFAKQTMTQQIQTTVTTQNVNEIVFDVLEGTYSAAIFNGTPEEYTTLHFQDISDYEEASVQVKETTVPWYSKYSVKTNDLFVAHQPEWIAGGIAPEIIVTKEMVEKAEKEYIDGGFLMTARTITPVGEVAPDSLICNLTLRVTLKGIDSYHQARAVVTGLALGKHINTRKTLDESVSHYAGMDSWKIDPTSFDSSGSTGDIVGTLTCFGLPSSFTGAKNDVTLTLEIMLIDLKTIVTYDVPLQIGDLIKRIEGSENLYMPISIVFPVVLPYVDPADGDEGGFGVDMEDWEKEEIEILNH